ncbi:Vitamin B12 import ATP-binding protein BtuD [Methylobacterium crusticola]|uniref:Vitamin B12 import ATP-binding protein BtuD n=1 Tax=Methylobacterium crusticola TaxID=1697972 RepID=A0ABQ4QTW1_9HYPH|nr:branched-chain amino acid ABC transporter ATP-binding protein/permease [Methylobacterium crusticola]GJD48763.1 Vitamin B12 import ATP-binding protein BtuD [Methylobacterium crusticola]
MPTRLLAALAGACLLAAPLVPGIPPFWFTLLAYAGLSAIVVIGLVVLTGVAGITSFGQAMFVGVGAYATALLTTRAGLSPWLSLPAALAAAAAAAWIIGAVTLRLSGHYLPLGTIAWNISFFYVLGNTDWLGRYDGLAGLPPITLLGVPLLESSRVVYLIWACVGLCVWLTQRLLRSRTGRAIRALKGGVVAAESFGIDTARAKIVAFVYAAVLAALSGWLYAHVQRAINPTPFSLNASIEYLLMAVIGGAGSIGGGVFGAVLVTVLKDQLQNVLPLVFGTQGNFEAIVFGVLLVLMLQRAPDGLWPLLTRRSVALPPDRGPAPRPLPPRPAAAPGTLLLEATALRKTFGGLVAVNDIGFSVRAGEVVALIGPNGAGKSTTFNLVTGVARLTAGGVRLSGREVAGLPARAIARLGCARTFQHVKLVAGMSVLENVALGAHLRGSAGPVRGALGLDGPEEAALFAAAQAALDRVGLGSARDLPAGSLALGQQRIVEIARALCLGPSLLLLDEPAAGLRHREKQALGDLLRRLRQEGLGILLVEHDMDFVMALADRLVVMNFGAKLCEGAPASVRSNPAVVEAYLGSAA